MRNQRPLGDYTDKAWLAGWDAGVCGLGNEFNPYKRPAQAKAWQRGRDLGLRSDDIAVKIMRNILARRVAITAGDRA